MGKRRAAAALAGLLCAGAPAAAQAFPGEATPSPSFPGALSLSAFGGFSGFQILRIYGPPVVADASCDSIDCRTHDGLTDAVGVALRVQVPLTDRTGLRLGASFERPGRRAETRNGDQVVIPPGTIGLGRFDALVLFRIKRQAPVFFGLGGTLAHYSPGPINTQSSVTEWGAAFAIGLDRRVSPRVGTRLEYTGFFMKPNVQGIPPDSVSRWVPDGYAYQAQLSFGVNLFLGVVTR